MTFHENPHVNALKEMLSFLATETARPESAGAYVRLRPARQLLRELDSCFGLPEESCQGEFARLFESAMTPGKLSIVEFRTRLEELADEWNIDIDSLKLRPNEAADIDSANSAIAILNFIIESQGLAGFTLLRKSVFDRWLEAAEATELADDAELKKLRHRFRKSDLGVPIIDVRSSMLKLTLWPVHAYPDAGGTIEPDKPSEPEEPAWAEALLKEFPHLIEHQARISGHLDFQQDVFAEWKHRADATLLRFLPQYKRLCSLFDGSELAVPLKPVRDEFSDIERDLLALLRRSSVQPDRDAPDESSQDDSVAGSIGSVVLKHASSSELAVDGLLEGLASNGLSLGADKMRVVLGNDGTVVIKATNAVITVNR